MIQKSIAQHIRPLGRRELEVAGRHGGVDLEIAERQHRALAKAVQNVQRAQFRTAGGGLEADANALQLAVTRFRHRLDPLLAAAVRLFGQGEILLQRLQVGRRGHDGGGRGAQHLLLLARRDLIQIDVVQPQRLAVGDEGLLERLGVDKAEFAGALELEGAALRLGARRLAVLGGRRHDLCERRLARARALDELRQAVEATGPGHGRTQGQHGRRSGQAREGGMVLKKLAHVHKSGILAPGSAPPGQESQS